MSVIGGLSANSFGDLVETALRAESIARLQATVNQICDDNGFPMQTYHLVSAGGLDLPPKTHFSNYPEDWVEQYIDEGLFFRDPVVSRAKEAVIPFSWYDLLNNQTPAESRDFLNRARAANVTGGFTIPVRGPRDFALFSACAGEDDQESNARIRHAAPFLTTLAMAVHETARRLYQPVVLNARGVKPLSPRQREIMQWIACGKSAWDISVIVGISESRVRRVSAEAFEKLGCRDRTHAVIRAVMLGIIEAPV